MLHAAATALHLAAEGRITARGRLASAIQPPLHHVRRDAVEESVKAPEVLLGGDVAGQGG
jgi:hypothetical protein